MMVDTVVVGAGIAGLMTARELAREGKRVQVLEARETVGGRLRTLEGIDMGAAWSWSSDSRLRSLAKELGIATVPQPAMGDAAIDADGYGYGSHRFPDEGAAGPGAVRFRGGLQSLVEKLAKTLPEETIETNVQVKGIKVEKNLIDGVVITTKDNKEYRAKSAVVTVPPRVAIASLQFEPALPDRKVMAMAATRTWMGDAMKVGLVYDTPWWRDFGYSGSVMSNKGPLSQIWDNSDDEENHYALAGFAFGEIAESLDNVDDDRVQVLVHRQLQRAMKAVKTIPSAKKVVRTSWSKEPLTHVEALPTHDDVRNYGNPKLRAAHERALFFGGTETHPEHGHVEGAVSSGLLAANDVLAFLETRETEIAKYLEQLEIEKHKTPEAPIICERHMNCLAADNARISYDNAKNWEWKATDIGAVYDENGNRVADGPSTPWWETDDLSPTKPNDDNDDESNPPPPSASEDVPVPATSS